MEPVERDWLRGPNAEDAALWAEVMRGVRPLPGRALPPEPVLETAPEPAGPVERETTPRRSHPALKAPALRPETLAERGLTGLDAKRAERLRRGEIQIDARLDLHGLTQDAAHRALDSFLAASIAAGRRCVLVITGKGTVRVESETAGRRFAMPEAPGVLRSALPRWIEQSPHRARVVALQPAHRKHGGEGAFYLYLRRER